MALKIGLIFYKQIVIYLFAMSFWLKYVHDRFLVTHMLLKICCYFVSGSKMASWSCLSLKDVLCGFAVLWPGVERGGLGRPNPW